MSEVMPVTQRLVSEGRLPFRVNKYMRVDQVINHKKVMTALMCDHKEVMLGGGTGSGKTSFLLNAALQYIDCPYYAALLLRRTTPQLTAADGMIPRLHQWLNQWTATGEVGWKEKTMTFYWPWGATLQLGHCEHEKDVHNFDGPAFHFVGVDQVEAWTRRMYLHFFTRMRKTVDQPWPLRMRSTANPMEKAIGKEWVKKRFIREQVRGRLYIHSTADDNPGMDMASYESSMDELKVDAALYRQMRHGDWDAESAGGMFMRSWFKMVPNAPGDIVQRVRFWDLAGTATDAADWTVGTLAGVDASGRVYLLDQRAVQAAPGDVEQLVRWTAEADGVGVPIFMQEDPGQAGKGQTDHYTRNVLMGYAFSPVPIPRVKGAKEKNAAPLSSYAQSGNVYLLEGDWNEDFLEQIEAFPNSKHDDRVESAAGAFQCLSKEQEITIKHVAARPDEFDDRDEYEMEKELAGLQFQ